MFVLRWGPVVDRGRAHSPGLVLLDVPSAVRRHARARGADVNGTLRTRAELDRFAAALATTTPHHLPLLDAVRAGRIAVVAPERQAAGNCLREAKRIGRPVLLLIGDDDHASTGPSGWRCARKLREWARAAIVHGTGGRREHYEWAATAAAMQRRLVMIETDSGHLAEWASPVRRCAIDGVRPARYRAAPARAAAGRSALSTPRKTPRTRAGAIAGGL